MGKKRGKGKREEDDFDLAVPSCRHIKKGTDQTLLKKLSSISDWTSCQDCKHEENKENISDALPPDCEEETEAAGMWMCLKCGHRGCGRNSENQHAIKHFETPRSDPHCLVVSLDSWSVWCYICDDEVEYSQTGHLAQLLMNLKKQTTDSIKRPEKRVKEEDGTLEAQEEPPTIKADESEENKENREHQKKNNKKETAGNSQKSSAAELNCGVSVKGLSNLGNTCFFNAVIQNLSQTQLLRQTLNRVTEEKMSVNIKPDATVDLEPIEVHLDQPGSLTVAMCQLLNEIQESKKSVVTPRELFSQVCKKAARFKGFQQQDSQELLRYLLDGMRAEELKRFNSGVMEALKQSRKEADGDELKTAVKEYEKSGCPKNFVDHVFGGETTSTIMCQQCKTVSVVTEMFLDLSLPVADEAYRKKNPKKGVQKRFDASPEGRSTPTSAGDDLPFGSGSKYQQKKAKKQAKKQAKHQKRQQKFDGRVTLENLPSQTEDQDGENADDEAQEEEEDVKIGDHAQAAEREDDMKEKEAEEGDSAAEGDSSISNRFLTLSEEKTDSMDQDGEAEEEEKKEKEEEEEEETELANEMGKVNLDDAILEPSSVELRDGESDEEETAEVKEYTVVNQDPELAFHTLSARKTPEKQECSVQSCLFQFTEVETLTQNNSLLCVTCTKRQSRKDKAPGSKKNVYTDALKQMLISSPPPVLTLHLKRFQQSGYSICKVNRHVQFPLVLDLAPFCAVKCKNTTEGDTQVLYSLYGMVEHSGTMRSGHYTAFVKVRPETSSPNGLPGEEPPKGSWFHISDTSVQPVSEAKVQSCQAYLLFYERIL